MLLETEAKLIVSVGVSSPMGVSAKAGRRRSLGLVLGCTVLGAAAQVLMKTGAGHVVHPGIAGVLIGMLTDPWLFTGYACYGASTVMLVLALRDGELSLLYPVIALTYVWVTVLSFLIFHEALNPFKLVGIAVVVTGVVVLGRSS